MRTETRVTLSPRVTRTFIDLFAGIGGFRLALESLRARCVFSSEINREARKVYEANFGELPSGDITQIDAKDVPDHDLLTGGFPCQAFSTAGKRQGFADDRGQLIFEVARILEAKQPKAFLLENVAGLLTHDEGKTFAAILHLLRGCGYDVHYQLINSRPWVPQARKRVYFVGFRADLGVEEFAFPAGPRRAPQYKTLRDVLERGVDRKHFLTPEQIAAVARAHARESAFNTRVCHPDGAAHTITSSGRGWSNLLLAGGRLMLRTLTPRELARLMGFPETFQTARTHNMAVRQFGNAVVVPVVCDIARNVIAALSEAEVTA